VEEDVSSASEMSPERVALELRQLALVDRILGLEAEVARLSAAYPHASARDEIAAMHVHLESVYGSRTWKVGRAVLRPLRALRRRR
jgi:hypothetical protein